MPWRAEGEFGARGEDGSSRNRREGSRGKTEGGYIGMRGGRANVSVRETVRSRG